MNEEINHLLGYNGYENHPEKRYVYLFLWIPFYWQTFVQRHKGVMKSIGRFWNK